MTWRIPETILIALAMLCGACSADETKGPAVSSSGGGMAAATGGVAGTPAANGGSGGMSVPGGSGGAGRGYGGAEASAGGPATGGAPAAGRRGAGGSSMAGHGGDGAGGASSGGAAATAGGANGGRGGAGGGTSMGWWKPAPGTSWQWQLSGKLDTSFDVDAYDIDLFDHSEAEIASLQAAGHKVICYFDTAYEPGRPDSQKLEPFRGNPVDGWPGQYWVDIRKPEVLDVMKARVALAATKHCDGIEADDVDQRSNDPGFPFTAQDQQGFIKSIANEAHAHDIAFGLKNDLEEIGALIGVSDFAINEECFQYDECDALAPFIQANKAVFQTEYTDGDLAAKGKTICPKANALNFETLIKHLDLDAPRYSCR